MAGDSGRHAVTALKRGWHLISFLPTSSRHLPWGLMAFITQREEASSSVLLCHGSQMDWIPKSLPTIKKPTSIENNGMYFS